MPTITPDFSEAMDLDNPVTPGVYKTRITKAEMKKANKTGADYVSWKLDIFGAEGSLATFNNRVVFHNTMIDGKGSDGLRKLFKAATGEELQSGQSVDTEVILGREIEVTLATRVMPDGTVSAWPDVKAVRAIV